MKPEKSLLLSKINQDICSLIFNYLDTFSLIALGQTCRHFHDLVSRELSFTSATWKEIHSDSQFTGPPMFHNRCLVGIDNKIYLPWMTNEPACFVFNVSHCHWEKKLDIVIQSELYSPFVTPVVAIGSKVYMFGGREIMSSTLSNKLWVLDIHTHILTHLDTKGNPPRPRFDHSLDVLQDKYLVVFGGMCSDSPGESDVFIFDTVTNTWQEPPVDGRLPSARFGHASVMVDENLYVYGGCLIQTQGNTVHDLLYRLDCSSWTWYKYDHPEAYFYRHQLNIHDNTQVSRSLQEGFVIETTGTPPRDRFQCTMCAVGRSLLVMGGQTIRQDANDTNELHVHSLRNIDVFDTRRKHWSSMSTSTDLYPESLTCVQVRNCLKEGHFIIVLGQHKIFEHQSKDKSRQIPDEEGYLDTTIYSHTYIQDDVQKAYDVSQVRGSGMANLGRVNATLVSTDPPVVLDIPGSESTGEHGVDHLVHWTLPASLSNGPYSLRVAGL
ncbi:hypothetical protein CLU79DRAFT_835048 [Phycomyces nitens]|nr:hypothetical protein CLU79DRAFT_835048 [Phycomyces nitens]